MTENPNETLCSTQFYNQIKRELNNSPCLNDAVLGKYNDRLDARCYHQLTDSTQLTHDVQIVLDNLKRSTDQETYRSEYSTAVANNYHNANNNRVIVNDKNVISGNKATARKNRHVHGHKPCTKRNCSHHIASCTSRTRNSQNNCKKMSSPESDCNSNVHVNALQQLATSIASSHDFTHDNSDYQWFLDYKWVLSSGFIKSQQLFMSSWDWNNFFLFTSV